MSGETREKLIEVARQHFAAKGFFGASLSRIAAELGISKQALLYHFGCKEDLYAEVLQRISEKLMRFVRMAEDQNEPPQQQFETVVISLYRAALEAPEDSRLLMREMLDNQSRAGEANSWYLDPFLDGLVSIVWREPALERRSDAELFSFVYQVLGAVEHFVLSRTTLSRLYGDEAIDEVADTYPAELQGMVRRFFDEAHRAQARRVPAE